MSDDDRISTFQWVVIGCVIVVVIAITFMPRKDIYLTEEQVSCIKMCLEDEDE